MTDRQAELLLNRLWTKAVGTEGYDKQEWLRLQAYLVSLFEGES